MDTTAPYVLDVTDTSFPAAVIEESHRRPVIVDFWASWCQPCRLIGPVLERLAGEASGAFLLAKLDVDSNPQASAAFGIQSIPAVKAFREGRVVNEFIGAIPERSIRDFIDSILPSEADEVSAKAQAAERAGNLDEAEALYARSLELDPGNRNAGLGLGRLLMMKGELDRARDLLTPLRPDAEAERLIAAIEVSEWGSGPAEDGNPLAKAERAAAEGRFRDAFEGFLEEVRSGGDRGTAGRDAMLKLFAVLGEEDPLTSEYRRRLAAALF